MGATSKRVTSEPGFASILVLVILSTLAVCGPALAIATAPPSDLTVIQPAGDAAFLAAHQPEGNELAGADALGFVIGVLVIAALVIVILILAKEV